MPPKKVQPTRTRSKSKKKDADEIVPDVVDESKCLAAMNATTDMEPETNVDGSMKDDSEAEANANTNTSPRISQSNTIASYEKANEYTSDLVMMENDEPIVLQLPISSSRIDDLIYGDNINSILTYNPTITDPEPYLPVNAFLSVNGNIENNPLLSKTNMYDNVGNVGNGSHGGNASKTEMSSSLSSDGTANNKTNAHHDIKCYWCCHNIIDVEYGMPIRYDVFHKSFSVFGSFCSLECAAAYNYSVNMGANRVWEIHSWIQLLGKKYGLSCPIRPAPSRYLLKMFNGPMDINEFRGAHKGLAQTCIMNIPPYIHINSQMECINTSFLEKNKESYDHRERDKDKESDKVDTTCIKSLIKADKNSLEKKMNLILE